MCLFPLIFCFSDLDCGGGICDFDSRDTSGNCVCKCEGCLQKIKDVCTGSCKTNDVGCTLKCECGKACDSYNSTDPESTIFRDGSSCINTKCDNCTTTNTTCPDDTDCIINDGESNGKCVDSGLCTTAKKNLCDLAYASVSGSTNQRAKCCPATSGCIRTQIGGKATSSCSTNCGSCLGGETAPGSDKNDHPETFCKFGQRLGEIWY